MASEEDQDAPLEPGSKVQNLHCFGLKFPPSRLSMGEALALYLEAGSCCDKP
jgi:hypothetical protein